ncbi:hypothetical protein J5N97_000050 [Dioscorea zingiberensis]|uniref:Glucosamine 6-phosphate N-acetyltransferase n=1 Tax=Dioscorea zingiberensis TaxID=325984 RepID=A0A9D5BVZ0_9LILI|nr:hypothetical protein J5N97_000050 [Dioscorea zingiberensis]
MASDSSSVVAAAAIAVEEPHLIRRLEPSDNTKGFIDLLSQLASCPPVPDDAFQARLAEINALGDDHFIAVFEDPVTSRIVATGSVFIEKKFLRGCSSVGHIEDIVVDATARGRRLGQRMVKYLVEHARASGCYKVILDCTPELRGFRLCISLVWCCYLLVLLAPTKVDRLPGCHDEPCIVLPSTPLTQLSSIDDAFLYLSLCKVQ